MQGEKEKILDFFGASRGGVLHWCFAGGKHLWCESWASREGKAGGLGFARGESWGFLGMGRSKGSKGTKGTKGRFTGALHLRSGP